MGVGRLFVFLWPGCRLLVAGFPTPAFRGLRNPSPRKNISIN
jgi:hypothetical protein